MSEDLANLVDKLKKVGDDVQDREKIVDENSTLKSDLADFLDKVEVERKKLTETKEGTGIIGEEQLRSKVSDVFTTILFYNGKPTESIMQRYEGLLYELNLSKDAAEKLFKEPLDNLNKKLRQAGKPEIIINKDTKVPN
jgi:hypothetical protein